MKKKLKSISKLLIVTGCVSVLAYNMAMAAPLVYDMGQPTVRNDYTTPNKINLSGNVHIDDKGQKINLSLRNTDVQQVLRMFADKAGYNIIFHKSVGGAITLDLVDVSLDEAFKMVLRMTDLTYTIKDRTIFVVGIASAENINLSKDNIMILPVKYADAAYLAQFLNTNIFGMNMPGLTYGPIVTTNSDRNELMIFGTDADYQMAKKIVDRFDKKPVMTTYRVNHTTPFEMAKMICQTLFQLPFEGSMSSSVAGYNTQLNASVKSQTSADTGAPGTIGGGTVACVYTSGIKTGNISSYQSKPTITIYVQPELGTLTMVGGSEQQIQMVNDFILENDRKQPQAYLEIAILELTEEGSKEFNNQWLYTGKHSNLSFTGTAKEAQLSTNSFSWHGPSNGSSAHTLRQTISYIIGNHKARMLANPKIVITNGKKSTIDLTQDYIESTTVQIVDNYNAGGGGAAPSVQKTFEIGKDNGIKVEVLPFISPDGYVSLDIKPDYSSIFEFVPDTIYGSTYTAATLLQRHNLDMKSIRIKDEETLLLGGFIQHKEDNHVARIPILGDIPIVGFFFRNQNKGENRTELLFMITPRIIKDTEDVAEL